MGSSAGTLESLFRRVAIPIGTKTAMAPYRKGKVTKEKIQQNKCAFFIYTIFTPATHHLYLNTKRHLTPDLLISSSTNNAEELEEK
jgi:hypothetical protein